MALMKLLEPYWGRAEPIYLQLYKRYRKAIAVESLQHGDRVPSVRRSTSELNIERVTFELAC